MSSDYNAITEHNERQLGQDTASRKTQISMYSDPTHFVYEILQNADDYGAREVVFKLSENELQIEHDGAPFTEGNVKAITYFGQSTSRDDLVKTGRFGVGFKSVFAFTATPIIISGDEHFQIHGLYRLKEHPYPNDFLRFRTRIVLPFNHESEQPDYVEDLMAQEEAYSKISDRLTTLNMNTLLFTRNIREIRWEIDGRSGHYLREDDINDNARLTTITDGKDLRKYLVFSRIPRWDNQEYKAVEIVFGIDEREQITSVDDYLYVLFATKEETHLQFILNGPYRTNPSRETISEDDPFNRYLIKETCELMRDVLPQLRERKLLTTQFLSVLPNSNDNLRDFYAPLFETIVETFHGQKLVPMKQGGHAAADGIFRGAARLSDLIVDDDLVALLGDEYSPPLWIANPPQIHQREDNFLSTLGIPRWTTRDLIFRLNELDEDDQAEPITEWLSEKPDKWHQEFYVLLGELLSSAPSSPSSFDTFNVTLNISRLPIVRLSDGTYRKGDECFFPDEDGTHDQTFPRVAKEVYSSGTNKTQQDKARRLLEDIGVRKVGEVEQIEAILKQRYVKGTAHSREAHHKQDIERFIALVETKPDEKNLFKDYFVFKLENGKWGKPSTNVFLDAPYLDTGLNAYYEALGEDSGRKRALSPEYESYGIEPERMGKFAKTVGAQIKLEPKKQSIPTKHPEYSHLDSAPGQYRWYTSTNEDYFFSEFETLLNEPSIDKARLLWRTMFSLSPKYLKALRRQNQSNPPHYAASTLVHDLRKAEWAPQRNGGSLFFVHPCDALVKRLPKGFQYEVEQPWLEAIQFGEKAEKESEEYKKREQQASNLGIPVRMVDDLNTLPEEEREEALKTFEGIIKQRKIEVQKRAQGLQQERNLSYHEALSATFSKPGKGKVNNNGAGGNGGFSPNPLRRREKTSEEIEEAIENEGAPEERSFLAVRKKWKDKNDQVRVDFVEWYSGQCQICKKTFTQQNGTPYFEGLYLVSRTTAEWIDRVGNVLCLCAEHSAKFQFGPREEVDEGIIQQVLRLKAQKEGGDGNPSIRMKLCGEPIEIKFDEKHLIDLQEMIKKSQEIESDG